MSFHMIIRAFTATTFQQRKQHLRREYFFRVATSITFQALIRNETLCMSSEIFPSPPDRGPRWGLDGGDSVPLSAGGVRGRDSERETNMKKRRSSENDDKKRKKKRREVKKQASASRDWRRRETLLETLFN
ncbi:hypothetical protein AVEN_36621-1 [Araneus ventricosus]|uniref:Uncharacterized protein n=1 Tax=Araneus ventricosus TaxID=182803 RepID=A0A4Y2T4J8_ARAVE|nr:hypothetical protein AVEN_36621-1 [Araneus ventricosus]